MFLTPMLFMKLNLMPVLFVWYGCRFLVKLLNLRFLHWQQARDIIAYAIKSATQQGTHILYSWIYFKMVVGADDRWM